MPREAKAAPVESSEKGHTLGVTVNETTWMSIKFSNGKKEVVTLNPGETKSWKFPETAVLKIGNAGGVKLNLDGTDLGSPGSSGEVKIVSLPKGN